MAGAGAALPAPRGGRRGAVNLAESVDLSALQAAQPVSLFRMHEALSEMSRKLSLSMARVEVRLHRTSRTSSHQVSTPPHFEYYVRCRWSGKPQAPPQKGRIADKVARRGAVVGGARIHTWWDELPQNYIVNRRWSDIRKLHRLITSELVYDPDSGLVRVKTPIPDLPVEGDLDTFVNGVAATGDASVLSEKGALHTQNIMGESALGKLADEHTILVENKLTPYFEQLSKVLLEIPAYQLRQSKIFRQFVTDGASCKHKPRPQDPLRVMMGPSPLSLEQSDINRIADFQRRVADRDEAEGTLGSKDGKAKDSSTAAAPKAKAKAKAQTKDGKAGALGATAPATASSSSPDVSKRLHQSVSAPQLASAGDADGTESLAKTSVSTHYSFMAQRLPGQALEATSNRDLWKRMVAKERREIGRRTLLHAGSMSTSDASLRQLPSFTQQPQLLVTLPPEEAIEAALAGGRLQTSSLMDSQGASFQFLNTSSEGLRAAHKMRASIDRLPVLPPPGPDNPVRVFTDKVTREYERSIKKPSAPVSVKDLMRSPSVPHRPPRQDVVERDICEGLRVIILGKQPPDNLPNRKIDSVQPVVYPPATPKDVMQLYGTYRKLLKSEELDLDEDAADAPIQVPEDLMPISWQTFFAWAEDALLHADDFRYKSVCGTFNRALAIWQQDFASAARCHAGVSLSLMFQWVWPGTDADGVAEMLTWICEREVEHIKRPTPEVMDKDERRRLESVFKSMDSKGNGILMPEDIAGGKDKGVESALKNIVDTATVTAVVGDRGIGLEEFLELMCEDDRRAAQHSVEAMQSDGRKVVLQKSDVVNFEGWVIRADYMTKEEEAKQRLIDALEAEILRWRRQAQEVQKGCVDEHGDGAAEEISDSG